MDKSQRFFGTYLVFFGALIALLLAIRTYETNLLPPPQPTTLVTPQPSPSSTQIRLSPSLTSTIEATETSTFTPTRLVATPTPFSFPTPFVGTLVANPPQGFFIEGWRNDYINCDSDPGVRIYGVIISGGTPPYKFIFWLAGTRIEPIISQVLQIEKNREFISFDPPIRLLKGKYVHVQLSFQSENGQTVTWIDDLYFPPCK
jgi:hypothetical protein